MTQPSSFAEVRKSTAAWRGSPYLRIMFLALLIAASGIFLRVDASPQGQDSPARQSANAKPTPKKRYRLRLTEGHVIGVSLKADKAKLTEIAADLSKRLGAQVILGPGLRTEAITVEFYDFLLEPALRLLAPRVFIDYEIRANAPPAMLAIYLMNDGDPDPAKNAVVQGSSEAMLIEGNTEDTPEEAVSEAADDPLQVDLDENQLTIKSKKQRLVVVVLTLAEVLEVPAEIKYDSTEIVDIEIKDTPFEDAITRLSPNIRLFVRADLTRSQRTPLRLVLAQPPTAKVADSVTNP